MSIDRPGTGSGRTEPIKLDAAAGHLLEECRMLLPGIQALLGFQLIAVFTERFEDAVSHSDQRLHLAAVLLVAIAVALVMAPAAIHRQTQQREVSERFIWISSRLMVASMFPLAIALSLDVYLVGKVILGSEGMSAALAGGLLAVFFVLWLVVPKNERRMHNLQKKRADSADPAAALRTR
jgi:hypothetical protein